MNDRDDPNYGWAFDLVQNHNDELLSRLLDLRGQIETLTEKNIELSKELTNVSRSSSISSKREKDFYEAIIPLIELGERHLETSWEWNDWVTVRQAQALLQDLNLQPRWQTPRIVMSTTIGPLEPETP
jgi:hypothetical protein